MFSVPNNRQAEHVVQILHEYRITAAGMYVCMHIVSNTICFKYWRATLRFEILKEKICVRMYLYSSDFFGILSHSAWTIANYYLLNTHNAYN